MLSSTGRGAHLIGPWLLARRSTRARTDPLGAPLGARADEGAEIDALLAAVGAGSQELALKLSLHLSPLLKRGVPPRWVEGAPVARAARLHFADGTTVMVKGAVPGDVGVLAVAMRRRSVHTAAFATGPEGKTQLLFTWSGGRHRLWLQVLGLDQPD
ncbi:MAG TPA: hypothetical protein VME46_03280 [Acidimicrobiales bacterium]|nr:hypothetical protein [Acidimicrobiales bacterium]